MIRRVLELRKSIGEGPTEVKEIYRLLNLGGYEFNTKDAQNNITGLHVSISKNTNAFAKLPNGLIGLVEWYPNRPKKARGKDGEDGGEGENESTTDAPAGGAGNDLV